MKKFFAVVKREYIQRVRTKFFVVATILGPLLMAAFTIVPPLMFGIKSGGPNATGHRGSDRKDVCACDPGAHQQ